MYRDNTLIPTEAVRLAALGLLMESDRRYGDVSAEMRGLISRVVGPSLDLLGSSLELLKIEGLIVPVDGEGMSDNALMRIGEDGEAAFRDLMTARVRAPATDISRLVIALKMRFLPLLDRDDQIDQLDMLAEATEADLARLKDLKATGGAGLLGDWLELDIAQAQERLDWFRMVERSLV